LAVIRGPVVVVVFFTLLAVISGPAVLDKAFGTAVLINLEVMAVITGTAFIVDRVYVPLWRRHLRGHMYVLVIHSIGALLDGTYGVVQG
jgi:hypothetical protein